MDADIAYVSRFSVDSVRFGVIIAEYALPEADEIVSEIKKTNSIELLEWAHDLKIINMIDLVLGDVLGHAISVGNVRLVRLLRTKYGHKLSAYRHTAAESARTWKGVTRGSPELRGELLFGYGLTRRDVEYVLGESCRHCICPMYLGCTTCISGVTGEIVSRLQGILQLWEKRVCQREDRILLVVECELKFGPFSLVRWLPEDCYTSETAEVLAEVSNQIGAGYLGVRLGAAVPECTSSAPEKKATGMWVRTTRADGYTTEHVVKFLGNMDAPGKTTVDVWMDSAVMGPEDDSLLPHFIEQNLALPNVVWDGEPGEGRIISPAFLKFCKSNGVSEERAKGFLTDPQNNPLFDP